MNRRRYIAILCGAGGISSGIIGSSAFSFAQMNREANIAITNDSDALIGLVPNPNVSGVHHNGGEMTIDLEDPGINQNSVYQFGLFAEDLGINGLDNFPISADKPSETEEGEFESAFLIANQTDNEQDLRLKYILETDPEEEDEFDTRFWFEAHNEGSRIELLEEPTDDTAEVTLGSGEAIGVSFLLDVPGDTLGERIEGSLAIDAGQAID